jgi:hypothetical protein
MDRTPSCGGAKRGGAERGGAHMMVLLLAAIAVLFVTSPSPAHAVIALQDVPPSITTVDGVVELSRDGGGSWTPAEPGTPVPAGDLLRTGDDGTCVLDFSDKSVVALLPLSTITLLPDDDRQRLQLFSGHIWVRLGTAVGYRNAVLAPHALVSANDPATFTLDFNEDGGTIRVMEGSVDESTPGGDYQYSAETGEALAAAKSGYSMAYPFDVATEQAAWEPVFTLTTTTVPDETTGTYPPPGDGEAREGLGLSEPALIVATGVLFLLLVAATTILVVLLARRRRPPAGVPPTPPAPPAQAPTLGSAGFCRSCGARFEPESRFCRVCGQEARPGAPGAGG